jgi:monoamine oxidase
MGQVQKLTLRFRHRLWDERTGFLHDPQAAFPTWWTQSPLLVPVITGWAGGPAARALVGAGEAAVLDAALATLARVLKRTRRVVESALDGWQRHDWASDPFSRGAYSYVRVGGLERQRALVRPFGGTIFIAGEATDPEETGTLNGALASGRRAARAIRRRLEAG